MVTPDGQSTMLGHWRVAVKQAEDAAQAGRIDEALALAARPDVADSRSMVRLRDRLGLELVARGGRRAEADDLDGAIEDLGRAEGLNVPPDILAQARRALADRVVAEVREILDAGDPGRAVERIDALARRKISNPDLRRGRELAEAWRLALDEARRGEFARALEGFDRAARLAGSAPSPGLATARRDVEARRVAAQPAVDRLYAALGAGKWAETLAAADALIEVVPEHPAARQARARAWQQIAAIPPGSATFPGPSGGRAVAVDLRIAPAPEPAPVLAPVVVAAEAPPRPAPALPPPPPPHFFFFFCFLTPPPPPPPHPLMQSSYYSCTYPSIHLLVHSFIHSPPPPILAIIPSPTYLFIHPCIHASIHAFIHSVFHSFSLSFIHSFIHSFIPLKGDCWFWTDLCRWPPPHLTPNQPLPTLVY